VSETVDAAERLIYIGRQREAHRKVGEAVRSGKLNPLPCQQCGNAERVQGHHRDYTKPLEVIWFCGRHHRLADQLEGLIRRCPDVVEIAVDSHALWAIAEVFAQELTNYRHRLPQCKRLCLAELAQDVEKCLALLLLSCNTKELRRAC
jgi:hypothetical protein